MSATSGASIIVKHHLGLERISWQLDTCSVGSRRDKNVFEKVVFAFVPGQRQCHVEKETI